MQAYAERLPRRQYRTGKRDTASLRHAWDTAFQGDDTGLTRKVLKH